MFLRSLLLGAVLVTSAAAAPAVAQQSAFAVVQPNWVMPTQGRGDRREDIRSLREVVEEVRSRYGGELISARLEEGSRPIYVLRWRMPDGQVRDFRVNAAR
jgi:uncharacterized membrane protein YkoI